MAAFHRASAAVKLGLKEQFQEAGWSSVIPAALWGTGAIGCTPRLLSRLRAAMAKVVTTCPPGASPIAALAMKKHRRILGPEIVHNKLVFGLWAETLWRGMSR